MAASANRLKSTSSKGCLLFMLFLKTSRKGEEKNNASRMDYDKTRWNRFLGDFIEQSC